MNVSSLNLSKELHELSGWDDTFCHWIRQGEFGHSGGTWGKKEDGFEVATGWVEDEDGEEIPQLPAYDLGFLLRKLPDGATVTHYTYPEVSGWSAEYMWTAEDGTGEGETCNAETPESAACQLAIDLLKLGVLAKEAA